MKILLLTDVVWNDKLYSNNVITNWFEDFPAEFANIYLAPGIPDNKCCSKYYQITDIMMLRSIFTKYRAGKSFEYNMDYIRQGDSFPEKENKAFYFFMRLIATEAIRLLRDWIWLSGKVNIDEISKFIADFNPDIIFIPRRETRKILRFERLLSTLSNCPLIAFTGDDEYTLLQLRFSPIYWLRRLCIRKDIREIIPYYSKYYMLSEKQAQFYRQKFNIDAEVLMKCGDFSDVFLHKELHAPIKLVYAGKLYCNRWKTLVKIKKALGKINESEIRMVLDIYTEDLISKRRRKQLSDGRNSFLRPPVNAEKLKEIYQKADIALHVEAFDLKSRRFTKYSFSTKIIDCLSSSCALVAICPVNNAGYQYLKGRDAAICIGRTEKIYPYLKRIAMEPQILKKYQKKAWACGFLYHRRTVVKEKLYQDMLEISKNDLRFSNEEYNAGG